jgi:Protein of unknown function (DUF3078)
MTKIFSIAAFLLLAAATTKAQDAAEKDLQASAGKAVKSAEKDGWTKAGTLIINVNQASLQNWAGGGEQNTLGINGIFNYGLNYRKGKNTWDNYFDIALGFQNATSFGRFRKTDDRIDITTKYGRQISKKWYAGVLANFNTQALEGFDYGSLTDVKISNILAPGKLLLSPGFDFKPNTHFTLFVSPVTARWIFKNDPDFFRQAKFGVDSLKKTNYEMGAFLTAKYNQPLTKWASYTGRLDLFSNYRRNPGNIDVFFTNLLAMQFNKWLGTTISVDVVYDHDVVKKTQVKEILGVGLTVKL